MQFHCPLKLPLLLCFLTQNPFLPWKKITLLNDLHHWKARTEMIFLSLVLMCQYILIWGYNFFNAAANICCPYLARPHSALIEKILSASIVYICNVDWLFVSMPWLGMFKSAYFVARNRCNVTKTKIYTNWNLTKTEI